MFVDTSSLTQGGRTYVRHLLRDSYRENGKVKHRTLANLSRCSEAEIAAIKLALKHKGDLTNLGSVKEVVTKQGMRVGAVLCLKAMAERVGLTRALGHEREGRLTLWQVMARLIDQGSRLSAVRLAESHAVCDLLRLDAFHEDHLYHNLAWLSEQQEAIEKRLFRGRPDARDGTPQLFLYDVTSSYLEGVENVLAAFGYNRDGKRGKKQLVIGLLTGPEGTPVAIRVFAGNTPDTQTVAEQVHILADSFGVKDVTLVAGAREVGGGMLKQTGIDLLDQERFHYISAITKPQIRKLLREGVFQIGLFEDKLCEVSHEGVRYMLRRNPERVQELACDREAKLDVVRRLLSQKNLYLAEHAGAHVAVAQRHLEEKVKQLKIDAWVKVVSQSRCIGRIGGGRSGPKGSGGTGWVLCHQDRPVGEDGHCGDDPRAL